MMENITNSSTPVYDEGRSTGEILEIIYLSNVALLTLLGNTLVILAFVLGPRSIRTYTNFFVANLAVSDLLVGCISLPVWIIFRIDESLISDRLFHTLVPLDILSGITSILNLAAISVERTLAVKFPSRHFNLSKPQVVRGIYFIWLCSIVLSMAKYGVHDFPAVRVYTGTIFTLGYVIPLFVIVLSYCVIFYESLHLMNAANHNASTTKKREIRIAKTISLVIGLFVICWTPFFFVNMVYVFCLTCRRPIWPIHVSKMAHYSNSMMNFFVYSARAPDFRNFFKKVFHLRTSRKTHNDHAMSRVTSLSDIDRPRAYTTVTLLPSLPPSVTSPDACSNGHRLSTHLSCDASKQEVHKRSSETLLVTPDKLMVP